MPSPYLSTGLWVFGRLNASNVEFITERRVAWREDEAPLEEAPVNNEVIDWKKVMALERLFVR